MPGEWINYGDVNYLTHGGMQVRRKYSDEEINAAEKGDACSFEAFRRTYQVFWLARDTDAIKAALCEVDITDTWIDKESVLGYIGERAAAEEYFAAAAVSYYGIINFSPVYFDNYHEENITEHQLILWGEDLSLTDREQGVPSRFIKAAEDAGFRAEINLGSVKLSKLTPWNLDISLDINGRNDSELTGDLYQLCKKLDPEESASMYILDGHGINGASYDTVIIINDMREVKRELEGLYLDLTEEKEEKHYIIPVTVKTKGEMKIKADSLTGALRALKREGWQNDFTAKGSTEEFPEPDIGSLLDIYDQNRSRQREEEREEAKKCPKR